MVVLPDTLQTFETCFPFWSYLTLIYVYIYSLVLFINWFCIHAFQNGTCFLLCSRDYLANLKSIRLGLCFCTHGECEVEFVWHLFQRYIDTKFHITISVADMSFFLFLRKSYEWICHYLYICFLPSSSICIWGQRHTSLDLSSGFVTCATTSMFIKGLSAFSYSVYKTHDLKRKKSPTSTWSKEKRVVINFNNANIEVKTWMCVEICSPAIPLI